MELSVERELLEGEAERALRVVRADGALAMLTLAVGLLGDTDAVERVPGRALPPGAIASYVRVRGRPRIYVRGGLRPIVERFAIAHELGHHLLDHATRRSATEEAEADYVGACLVVPRLALRDARRILGDDIEALAELFVATQTCVSLRLGEAGALSAVVVVAPNAVRARSIDELVLPPEGELRRLANWSATALRRTFGSGVRKAKLTDDWRRAALMFAEVGCR